MHNGEAQPRPMSATMDSTVSSVGTKKVPERLQTHSECICMDTQCAPSRVCIRALRRCTPARAASALS